MTLSRRQRVSLTVAAIGGVVYGGSLSIDVPLAAGLPIFALAFFAAVEIADVEVHR